MFDNYSAPTTHDAAHAVISDDGFAFHAPVQHGLIDGLLGQYDRMRARLEEVAALVKTEIGGAVGYFIRGSNDKFHRYAPEVDQLFNLERAIAALNADFWGRALALTDVYNYMPQARRDEWNNDIHELKTPDFDAATVGATIETLLLSREKFFAERVDGIFRGLSGNHVTNRPEAFHTRMILEYVFNNFHSVESSKAGVINDLRVVIARFMGRDEPRWSASSDMLTRCRRNPGEWHDVDGGALRVRVYKKGTAHIEIHPEIAYRLNSVLAFLHPHAIPASQRTKPAKPNKSFRTMMRPLPFEVVAALADARLRGHTVTLGYGLERHIAAEALRVLESIGGTHAPGANVVEFDYDARDILDAVITSGCIPDQKTHQFYPTPASIAQRVIDAAEITEASRCLEPSAGLGALASLIPPQQVTCVEISQLHCDVLQRRGYAATCADFLAWAPKQTDRFDAVVTNPPFSDGRALAHVTAAAGLLAPAGRLVAVLPASLRGRDVLPGFACSWSEVIANEFAGTSVSVAILTAHRSGC